MNADKKSVKFVPYDKLSKKERRKIDLMRRRDWGNVRPCGVTEGERKYCRRVKHKKDITDFE